MKVVELVEVLEVVEVWRCEGVRPPGVSPLPADKGCDHCQPGELRVPTLDNPDLPGGSSNMNQHQD